MVIVLSEVVFAGYWMIGCFALHNLLPSKSFVIKTNMVKRCQHLLRASKYMVRETRTKALENEPVHSDKALIALHTQKKPYLLFCIIFGKNFL